MCCSAPWRAAETNLQEAESVREAFITPALPLHAGYSYLGRKLQAVPLHGAKPETSFPATLWDCAQILRGPESVITAR